VAGDEGHGSVQLDRARHWHKVQLLVCVCPAGRGWRRETRARWCLQPVDFTHTQACCAWYGFRACRTATSLGGVAQQLSRIDASSNVVSAAAVRRCPSS
jgi:hypothetical protein